jgi:hypothetical protein
VLGVTEIAVQRGEPKVDEFGVAGPAEEVAKAEDVGHPRGDPQLLPVALVGPAVVVQPPELPVLGRGLGAVEEPVDLGAQIAAQLLVQHWVGHGSSLEVVIGTAIVSVIRLVRGSGLVVVVT